MPLLVCGNTVIGEIAGESSIQSLVCSLLYFDPFADDTFVGKNIDKINSVCNLADIDMQIQIGLRCLDVFGVDFPAQDIDNFYAGVSSAF